MAYHWYGPLTPSFTVPDLLYCVYVFFVYFLILFHFSFYFVIARAAILAGTPKLHFFKIF